MRPANKGPSKHNGYEDSLHGIEGTPSQIVVWKRNETKLKLFIKTLQRIVYYRRNGILDRVSMAGKES